MIRSLKRTLAVLICTTGASALAQDAAPVALAGNDLHPTPITLHMKNQPVGKVLEELSRQAGCKFVLDYPVNERVSVDADAAPLWTVVNRIADQGHLGISQGFWNDSNIHLGGGAPVDEDRRVVAGPVMAAFSQIERFDQMTAPLGAQEFCDLQAQVNWEPRLAVAFFEGYSVPTLAVDENGASLVPPGDFHDPRNPGEERIQFVGQNGDSRGASFQHSIHLKIPANAGRRLAHITGTFHVYLVDKSESVDVPDLKAAGKKAPTLNVGVNRLKVQNIWQYDQQVQMQFEVSKNTGESEADFDRRKAMLHSATFRITDADDKAWSAPVHVQSVWDQSPGTVGYSMWCQRDDNMKTAPKKITIEVPTSTVSVDVPYDLKDLPLP